MRYASKSWSWFPAETRALGLCFSKQSKFLESERILRHSLDFVVQKEGESHFQSSFGEYDIRWEIACLSSLVLS